MYIMSLNVFAVFGEFTFDSEVDIVRTGEYNP